MKMAKADQHDLDMAVELCGALEAITTRWFPVMPEKIARPDTDCEHEPFDKDDEEQCKRLADYLCSLADRASLMRVVYGMVVVCSPENKLLDPAADTLEYHPDVKAAIEARQPRPLEEWHEGIGPALWWRFPVDEPPYSGTPMDTDWPGYHTHWTPVLVPHAPAQATTVEATAP